MESPVRSWAGSRKSSRPFRIWAGIELIVSWFYMSTTHLKGGGRRDDEGDSAGKDENQTIIKTMSTHLSKISKR